MDDVNNDTDRIDLNDKIVSALVSLAEKKDLSKITVTDLAQKAGIPRTTFYRKYDNIEDLVLDIENNILDTLRELSKYAISSSFSLETLDIPNKSTLKVLKYLYSIKDTYVMLTSKHGDPNFRCREEELIREFYSGRVAFRQIVVENPDVYTRFAIGGQSAALDYWLVYRQDISPEEMCVILQHGLFGIYK